MVFEMAATLTCHPTKSSIICSKLVEAHMHDQGLAGALWAGVRRTLISSVALICLALLAARSGVADDTALRDGHADRQAWETWFGGLSGTYRDGATFWASHRSEPNPPD
jgi:hypothetical protein